MSPKLPYILLALATAAGAARGYADEGVFAKDAHPRMHGSIDIETVRSRAEERFARLDANQDGVLELAEFEPPHMGMRRRMRPMGPPPQEARNADMQDRLFERLDADGSGELSREELANVRAARRDMMKEHVFERLDASADGHLTFDEFAPQVARLKELDVNGDGLVTEDERPRRRHRQPGNQTGA